MQRTKILVYIVQLGSTKTMPLTPLHASLVVEMGSESDSRNETMITQQMEMGVNQTALLSSRAGFVMEEMLRTRTHALFEQLDSTKTTLLIQLSVSLVVEMVSELDLKNVTTTTQQMEMAASQIDRVLRVAGYVMEEVQQTKILVPIVQLGSTKMMLHILLNVFLVVEMVSELDPRNEMMITQLMEMAVNQTALLSSRAGYEMEEARQVKTRAISELLGTIKTMLHIQLSVSLVVEMALEWDQKNETTTILQMETVVNQTALLSSQAGYVMEEVSRRKIHVHIALLGSTKMILLTRLFVSLTVVTAKELDPKNETTTTQQMEMAASQIDQVLRVAGFVMEEVQLVKTRALFELLDSTKTMLHFRLNVFPIEQMVSESDLNNEMIPIS